MSRESQRRDARRLGEQKLQEAQRWWAAWERSIHKYRCWATIYISRQYTLHQLDQKYGKPEVVAQAAQLIAARNAAHDYMLLAKESMGVEGECAVACEGMARIYFEEHEGREAFREALIVGELEDDHD